MSDEPHVEPLPTLPVAGNDISFRFAQPAVMLWEGRAFCKHGTTTNVTYLIAPGVPPLNHAGMVDAVRRQHQLVVGCDCSYESAKLNATVTFGTALGVEAGAQRYIPQTAATIEPPRKNFLYGPRLTCLKLGAYEIVAKVQLSRSLAQGARGLGVVVVSGVPVTNVVMVDEAGKATANINVMLNLAPNQSVELGYENTSAVSQDVTLTTMTVSEVWVP